MVELKDFKKITPFQWILEKGSQQKMKTNVRVFATEVMLKNAIQEAAIQQVINVSTLPGIISDSIAMPDIHYGYGFCIGGRFRQIPVLCFRGELAMISTAGFACFQPKFLLMK
jgi:hypothetical protein